MTTSVKFVLKSNVENGNNLYDFFSKIIQGTRDFSGCQGAELHRSKDDPATFMLIEKWASPADFDEYLAWRKGRGDFNTLISNFAVEPEIQQFDVTTV